ncbi:MAG: alkyl hydroperoxide reductase AhpD [Rhodomicrobium sp.]|nr:MAG: alkyl hydroperoxide reductase AhpD [Rhodomicrobium sp.]
MSRIPTPASINEAPTASQPILEAVNKQLGSVPNIFRMVSNSPAALEGYASLNGALGKGKLDPQTRERIALAVAEVNGCNYCLSAHTYLGKNLAKLDDVEIAANRGGTSTDPKAVAAVRFAITVLNERGHINNEDLNEVRAAGYSNEEIIEIVQHVALNVWTNFINEVAQTEIDFPVVDAEKAA